ncbi:VOC family protein [Lysinibacillus sp. NPDC097231]|uniref:VOC family protein n=1 Tax=Lysinibacillus sp. NPDC097231 TaxID=3364142 RepID=UPI0037F8E25A
MSQVCVISIYVPDIKEAIHFYTTVLGFEVNKQYGPTIVTLVHGDLPIVLEETENAKASQDNDSMGVVLALKTEDIYQTLKKLREHNVHFVLDEPMDCPPGKVISFKDPFGNVLEYLQFI